ncbi:NADH dehydrogenase [ubiquinone] 1 alpha subcomplex subunit 13 [Copidosoma floridanum]|uniref:NADH dehydrogenase [ubiquinone] 1 alpha subcomplex subunit 13 n=1 Tax=Copidosoma floridanum TaxID=29053 RepID=UPI0006C9CDD8|nr:NADH dehydrogenase [ubiquinone] 1 alpha subcomplex subunit 13 [Copidosoma floridanum]
MASAPKSGPQDMPPPGGYNPMTWQRIKLKTFFTSKLVIGLYVAATAVGFKLYTINYREYHREQIEMRSARHVIMPLLLAERDRAFLKQCRVNRDEERELMKNVPEWEVGTYFREPVYITMPDKFHEPTYHEFFGHSSFFDASYRVARRHLS